MAKISPVSAKYIIHTNIQIEGVVDKPDVIGAIFGQTEGLLGNELELRELQRSGRIGRIEVNLDAKGGRSAGAIIIPSSMDKAETAIIAASLETIQRIGPCNSKVKVEKIEDVRVSKRGFVLERAKELLRELTSGVLPDSQELTDQVAQSVRMMEVMEYGQDRLACGPGIDESEEIIIVEGRADVLNLLKHGIKNVIAANGTSAPPTLRMLASKKDVVAFVDGDRGGDLIIRGLLDAGVEIDFVVKAPDGKEVEEIAKKEIHKALRGKMAIEQYKLEVLPGTINGDSMRDNGFKKMEEIKIERDDRFRRDDRRDDRRDERGRVDFRDARDSRDIRDNRGGFFNKPAALNKIEAGKFKELLDDLVGTKGAYILDEKLNVLGKVPVSELFSAIRGLPSSYAIVVDGVVDRGMASMGERANVKFMVGMASRVRPGETRVRVMGKEEL